MLHPAYVAGLFDGEGSVSLVYTKRRPKKISSGFIYGFKMRVYLSNTNEKIIEELKENFGGSTWFEKPAPNHKPVKSWHIQGSDKQRAFLNTIKDFTFIKEEHVDVALKYLETVRGVGQRLSQEDWDTRVWAIEQLQRLNHRGTKPWEPVRVPPESVPVRFRPSVDLEPEELHRRMAAMRAAIRR